MYENNGINYTSGLSTNPQADKARARKRIILSSVFLGIGALTLFVGFILMLVASSIYSFDTTHTCVEYDYYDRIYYSDGVKKNFYSNSGGYFSSSNGSGNNQYTYYYDESGAVYRYDIDTQRYHDEYGNSYDSYSSGNYYSYKPDGTYFYHMSGSFCYDKHGNYYYFEPNGDFTYSGSGGNFYYNKAGNYFRNQYGTVYSFYKEDYYRNSQNTDIRKIVIPGKFDFSAPERHEIFHDIDGNYYMLDDAGFYYCDKYGSDYSFGVNNHEFCYVEEHYYYDGYSTRTAGVVFFLIGCGLSLANAILLSKGVKTFKASKCALRQAQGYAPYGTPAAARPAPAARRSFCTCCGAKADSDAVYCVNCGHKI